VGDDASSINSGIFDAVTLGAPFDFYGMSYAKLVPATNGYLTTDLADGGPDLSNDCPLPAHPSTPGGTPGARFYPLHDDLVTGGGQGSPTGGIFYEFFADCPRASDLACGPEPCSVFQWNDANHFGGADYFDFQAVLYHDSGEILYQYGAGNPEQGSSSTTGIMDPTKTIALTYACNTFGSIQDDMAIAIVPPAEEGTTFEDDGSGSYVCVDASTGYYRWSQETGGPPDVIEGTGRVSQSWNGYRLTDWAWTWERGFIGQVVIEYNRSLGETSASIVRAQTWGAPPPAPYVITDTSTWDNNIFLCQSCPP